MLAEDSIVGVETSSIPVEKEERWCANRFSTYSNKTELLEKLIVVWSCYLISYRVDCLWYPDNFPLDSHHATRCLAELPEDYPIDFCTLIEPHQS